MGIYDEVRDEALPRRGPDCSFVTIFDRLDVDDAAELQQALEDSTVTSSAIHKVLKRRGFPVGYETVKRHRNGKCRCVPHEPA